MVAYYPVFSCRPLALSYVYKILRITKWGYRDGVKSKGEKMGDGLYTWCSKMSDRIA